MSQTKKLLTNLPPKGTSDWFPTEFQIRKYIFDNFRKVCKNFGYEEYLTPTFEKADIYRAKSGEDVGGKELMIFRDKVGRELALRPEMTPSVTRMISRVYGQTQKPIRFFSIANFFRNEKPQRGRNREFWQLNYDLFGSDSIYADIEIIKVGLEIMLNFIPIERQNEKPFITYINDRRIILSFLEDTLEITENINTIVRILDKKEKLSEEDFKKSLTEYNLNTEQINKISEFMSEDVDINSLNQYVNDEITQDIKKVFEVLEKEKYGEWIKFKPNLIRGFDYYTGIVYEIFDKHEENRRSLFGGGRYDGLADIFGKENIPAVGCAPGDEGIRLFLESWELLDCIPQTEDSYYLPILEENARTEMNKIAKLLREQGSNVIQGLERESITKALDFANKKGIPKVIILGSNELQEKQYVIKNMGTGKQTVRNL